MQRVVADCRRTESSIAIITCGLTDHPSYDAFYSCAIGGLLRDWWDVEPATLAEIDTHTKQFARIEIAPTELLRAAESLLVITPIADFDLSLGAINDAFSIRDEWNFREYGWIGETEYGLLVWETSA